jgi:hypothetical protein
MAKEKKTIKEKIEEQEKIEEVIRSSRFRNMMIVYFDILIRSLISFFAIGILLSILLIGVFHFEWWLVLPLVFICSIFVAPFLSKIKLGERVFDYYEQFLKKTFKLKL